MTDRRWEPIVVLACVIVLLAMHTRTYAITWRSDLSLWSAAIQVTPEKPRPWINVGAALAQHGRYDEARVAWLRADRLADHPWVPRWDRVAGHALAQDNIAAIDRVHAMMRAHLEALRLQ